VLIADDDPSSRKLMHHFITSLPGFEIVGEVKDGQELIQAVITKKPDIALCDISMPKLSGLEAIKSCKELLPSLQVIFITGHEDFALEAFEVKAVDYILKPIERNRVYSALERAAKISGSPIESDKAVTKDLVIKQHNSLTFVSPDEIIFIERKDRKSVVHTHAEKYEANESLTSIGTLLDSRFMTSHRSYIINLDQLTKIEASGQIYYAFFKNYPETAKISKHKLTELQRHKSL
jgi:two-component system, LytTR family, response regulator